MEKFNLHILGCGSALPTTRHFPTSQVIDFRDKLFMIDCGEGAQLQMRKQRLRFGRLGCIFISHLHGDHCFGLLGLISTLNLLGRTADLHIYSPAGLEQLMGPMLTFFNRELTYQLVFHEFGTKQCELIYEDRSLAVTTLPLKHRMPCCGFLFAEKQGLRHIRRDMIDFYQVPVYELNRIKNGADFITPDGELVANDRLTLPPNPVRRYAYLSDTMPLPALTPRLHAVDLLFHEATFADDAAARARETRHSTARQAAEIAVLAQAKRLIIGHFSARYDDESQLLTEARQLFPEVELAAEGKIFSI